MRTRLFFISTVILLLLSGAAGCAQKVDIRDEVVYYLVKMNKAAVSEMDAEAERIGQELYAVMEKLAKLRQVTVPAFEWIELQNEELPQKKQSGSWRTEVTEEWLAEFKNDQYRITHLEFQARNIGEKNESFTSIIKVTDLTENIEKNVEMVYGELEQKMVDLESGIQSIRDKKLVSSVTLNGAVSQWQAWDIQEIDDINFTVSGPGLGFAGDSLKSKSLDMAEKLINGQWTYHRDSGEVVPSDSQSAALEKILRAKF